MNVKIVFAVTIIISLLAGAGVGYFTSGYINTAMVNGDAKALAARVKVTVINNGLSFTMSPDSANVRVIYWKTGGQLLATGSWVDAAWQLDLGAEDKPTDQMQGDKCDIILKIMMPVVGNVHFECSCGGEYVKRIYFDNVLKLDTSTGTRFVTW